MTARSRLKRIVVCAAFAGLVLGGCWLALTTVGGDRTTETPGSPSRPSCASTLLTDWADGRIDGTYPIHCYRDAMKSLPADLEIYSSAPDDIARALQRRIVLDSANGRLNRRP